jgi:hypothetical protein
MTGPSTPPRSNSTSSPPDLTSLSSLSIDDLQSTPRGTSPVPPSASLSEKRLGDPERNNPPGKIDIPAMPPTAREFARADRSIRRASVSEMNAAESHLANSVNASLAQGTRSGRTPAVPTTKKESKRSSSKQPIRRDSEAGYEGGEERHGQANDFIDEDDYNSDEPAAPKLASTEEQFARQNRSEDTTASSAPALRPVTNTKFPDLSSAQRNRNPSASIHQHPRLPVHGKNSSSGARNHSGFRSQQSHQRNQASSVTSTRSVEATQHPFRTPASKETDGLFDEWQSVEEKRLDEDGRKERHWKRWGPYVSERQWVRLSFQLFKSII